LVFLAPKKTRIVSFFSASIKRNYVLQGRNSSLKLSENGSIFVFGENEKTELQMAEICTDRPDTPAPTLCTLASAAFTKVVVSVADPEEDTVRVF